MSDDQRIAALSEALMLAIVAPSDEQCRRAVELAEKIAAGMSKFDVARAKRAASELADRYEDKK